MNNAAGKINYSEAELFYKSPYALVDYTSVQSFTLIKSCIELFAYYGAEELTPGDIKEFFTKLQLTQKKNGRVFVPSEKKIEGVLDCCLDGTENVLSLSDGVYHIVSWNTDGYRFELAAIKNKE